MLSSYDTCECFCDWSVLFGCLTVIGEPPEHPALHHGLHGLPLQVGEAGRVPESLGKGVAVDLQFGDLHTEPEFLNFKEPRNRFQGINSSRPMPSGGPVRQSNSDSVPSPYRLFKNSSTGYVLVLLQK
jgi:hypothetical protein